MWRVRDNAGVNPVSLPASRLPPRLLLLIAVVAFAVTEGAYQFNLLSGAERVYSDLWHQLVGQRHTPRHVALVEVDEASLAKNEDPLVFWAPQYAKALATLALAHDADKKSVTLNFAGQGNRNGVLPPDTNGDVGPNHYVQWVNLSLAIYSKTGTLLYGPTDGNTLWAGFGGPCQTSNDGDPIVLYDALADRWMVSQFALPS